MNILGIETSCDETAAAVVENGTKILSNVVATSADMHTKTGGIIPENAARQQIKSIIPVIQEALTKAFPKHSPPSTIPHLLATEIDAIAVTAGGPGLIGSMLVGVETAKTLAYLLKKPLIPTVHLYAHLYANWLNNKNLPKLPAIVLTVSGGHTELLLMRGHGKFTWIGGTRDDAAGEAFDKTARLLGLPYPGGPSISKEAERFFKINQVNQEIKLTKFPRPMLKEEGFDFSFSGLKTAVLRHTTEHRTLNTEHLSAEVQEAIVDVLVEKSVRAIEKFKPKSFLLAGGVSANKRLREILHMKIEGLNLPVALYVPPTNLCTDNATFIASCAYYNNHPMNWKSVRAIPNPYCAWKKYGNN